MTENLVYTIGHSDHETTAFIDLLRQHALSLVVDVRSQPYSRWTHQFNRETLAHDLAEAGIGCPQNLCVGPRKLELYGTAVIELVREYLKGGGDDSQNRD